MAQHYIGRYEVIAELGRGGMATVFHAYDPDFDRPVAIKVMPREFLHVPDFRARFQREARTIAALEHDAIVPVHDIGEHDDLPFLVMRYMPGGSLSDRIALEPLSLPEAVRLFDRIAPAIDFAHAQGFVHRDLKPDNILFDQHDNAFIADFGIAKLMHSTSQLTGSSALIGTPAYMSPEQIQDKGEVDHRSDLYALGVILYETLTGQMPFKVESSVGYFSAHLNDPIPDIRAVRPDLPPAFSSIIYRAMAKDKDERYQSAADLAADIAYAQDSDTYIDEFETPIIESTPTRRIPYALIGGIALILIVVGVVVAGGLGRTKDAEGPTAPATQLVDNVNDGLSADSPTTVPEEISPTPSSAEALRARLAGTGQILFNNYVLGDIGGANPLSPAGQGDLFIIDADGRDRIQLTVDSAHDCCAIWSPDGSQIVFSSDRHADPEGFFSGDNLDLYMMDSDGSNVTHLVELPGTQTPYDWSPDGRQILFGFFLDDILLLDLEDSSVVKLTNDGDVHADGQARWSPDGSQIVFASDRMGSWDLFLMESDGSNPRRLTLDPLNDEWWPDWSPDGSRIAFVTVENNADTISILDLSTREVLSVTGALSGSIQHPRWSPDGRFIVFWGDQGILVLELETGDMTRIVSSGQTSAPSWRPSSSVTEPDPAAESIDLRTAGWIVYSYASDADQFEENSPDFDLYTMRADGQERTRLTVSDASEENPAWSPDGTHIAFNSDRDGDKEIYVMDEDGLNQTRLTFSEGSDFGPRWSPDGSQIVFASERDGNREIYIMDADGSNQTRLTDNAARDYWPDWSPDGSQIVFSSSRIDGVEGIFIMNADGTGLYQFMSADNYARLYPRWSPDGTQIAVFSQLPNQSSGGSRCGTQEDTLLINIAGSNRADPALVNSSECLAWATWSPDGRYMIGLADALLKISYPPPYNFQIHASPDFWLDGQSLIAQLTDVSLQELFHWPDWKP